MRKLVLTLLLMISMPSFAHAEDAFGSLVDSVDSYPFIVVNKQFLNLSLVDSTGTVLKQYGIACAVNYGNKTVRGDHKTPEGIFKINQVLNSQGLTHDFGDGKGEIPDAYGPWFLRLDVPEFNDIGIHGTHLPESIGTRATEGCVRMRNEDVLELKELVSVGTPVIILADPILDVSVETMPVLDSTMRRDIFISYCQQDRKLAESIYSALDSAGISMFMVRTGYEFGTKQTATVAQLIDACKEYVFIRSTDSDSNPYLLSELLYAIKRKAPEQIHVFSYSSDEDCMGIHSVHIEPCKAGNQVLRELRYLPEPTIGNNEEKKPRVILWGILSCLLIAGVTIILSKSSCKR